MKICCAGEVMVEMAADAASGRYLRGMAGDSFNTAVYLARAGLAVNYLTRLGDDPFSDEIVAFLQREGIDDRWIERCPGHLPGLYTISNDAGGERRFHYWRDAAPVRSLFAREPELPGDLDLFYLTGITLAVTRRHLDRLLALLDRLRAGGCRVAFDPNYRPALWDDAEQARRHCQAVLARCDIVLPTLDDDMALWSLRDTQACHDLYAGHGISEIVVKGPALTTYAWRDGDTAQRQARAVQAVDTTGAGDSFNAGYLAARLGGACLAPALAAGQNLAADVVQHRGAILPRQHTVEGTA